MTQETEFLKIINLNKGSIYTICYMFSKDKEEVYDLYQEVILIPQFVSLHESMNIFEEKDEDSKQIMQLYKRINKLGRIDRAIILLWLESLSNTNVLAYDKAIYKFINYCKYRYIIGMVYIIILGIWVAFEFKKSEILFPMIFGGIVGFIMGTYITISIIKEAKEIREDIADLEYMKNNN